MEKFKISNDKLNNFLNEKNEENLIHVTEAAVNKTEFLNKILSGLKSKQETFRYNCYKVIYQISKTHPRLLYIHWNYFLELLKSNNAYHRMAAIEIISNLTITDTGKKFDLIFDDFFQLLDDKSVIVARYLAINAGIIAKYKPYLRGKIIEKLLGIKDTHHNEDRKDLIKHDIIQSFSQIFEKIKEKDKIISFVEKQIDCSSPKTRKVAKAFLEKWKK